jgi:hypothetical protein
VWILYALSLSLSFSLSLSLTLNRAHLRSLIPPAVCEDYSKEIRQMFPQLNVYSLVGEEEDFRLPNSRRHVSHGNNMLELNQCTESTCEKWPCNTDHFASEEDHIEGIVRVKQVQIYTTYIYGILKRLC